MNQNHGTETTQPPRFPRHLHNPAARQGHQRPSNKPPSINEPKHYMHASQPRARARTRGVSEVIAKRNEDIAGPEERRLLLVLVQQRLSVVRAIWGRGGATVKARVNANNGTPLIREKLTESDPTHTIQANTTHFPTWARSATLLAVISFGLTRQGQLVRVKSNWQQTAGSGPHVCGMSYE